MSVSTGKTARGLYLTINGTEVANVKSIAGIDGREAEEIDFTHLRSDGGYRELRQGFKDPGTITLNLHFDPTHATHANGANSLDALLSTGETIAWELIYTDTGYARKLSGSGFLKGFSFNHDVDNPIEGTATIRVSGATTWANT
jgi:Lambda phage tail tube protein, TTP